MQAIKDTRKFIERHADHPDARVLSALVLALETEVPFAVADLYKLEYDNFKRAMAVLQDWRLDRYYASKLKLIDTSLVLSTLPSADTASAEATDRARGAKLGKKKD